MSANEAGRSRGILDSLSLRGKLILLLISVTFVALVVGFGLNLAADIRLFRTETAASAKNLAAVLAEFSVGPLSFDDADGTREILVGLETSEAMAAAAVYDAGGNLFAAWNRHEGEYVTPGRLTGVQRGFGSGFFVATKAVAYRGENLGTVVIRLSTAGMDRKIIDHISQVALIFIAVLVLCIALAFWLQRIISGPIVRLSAAADKVSVQEDLAVRVQPEGRDEIARLCDAFNLMLSRLEARQQERDAAARLLYESEAKYRAIVQDQTELVFRFRPDGTLLFMNEAYCRYWELKYEDLIGNSVFDQVAEEDQDSMRTGLASLTTAGKVSRFSYRVSGPGNEERWHECTCRAIGEEGRPIEELQGVARDITDLRRMEKEKQDLARQLEHSQRLETIGTLAGGIAHDFNNILTPIIGCLELVKQEVEQDSDSASQLAIAAASALRAKDLVQQILTFSRNADHERTSIRVQDVVAEALRLLSPSLPPNIEFATELDLDCDPVLANGSQLHQIVVNLCTNAAHAIGDITGVIELRLDQCTVSTTPVRSDTGPFPGRYARLMIRDNGPGMADHVRQRVFEPFFTTKAQGEGTGLGLSVVHGIVVAHNGHIEVATRQGEGTTFTILLPQTAHFIDQVEAVEPVSLGGTGRVLVVDDEPLIAMMSERMLENLGYEAISVTSPDEALAVFSESGGGFDLVITDQAMPGMPGTQLATKLGEISPGVRVVIASGFNRESPDYAMPETVKLVAILSKPYTLKELDSALRQAFGVEKS